VSSFSRRLLVVVHGEGLQLLLSSALAVTLLAARMLWTGAHEYMFLVWNLFLAWVPYAVTLALRSLHERRVRSLSLAPLFLVWLGFLPNAPYLVTDFIHLRFRDGAPLWFDAVMLASFAWAGVGLGAASLRGGSRIVRARGGAWTAAAFVPLVALATGFGIYLGRFVRLNTWDVATRPGTVLVQILSPLVHPFAHPRAWTVSLTFALFFVVATIAGGRARSIAPGR
jgi:uncharacterized membrane protein